MSLKEKVKNIGKKGFRQPTKKAIRKQEQELMEERKERASAFLVEYKELTKKFKIEFGVKFEEMQFGSAVYQGQLILKEYQEPEKAEVTPWSTSLRNNLKLRSECQHIMNEEETACEKCRLSPNHFGAGGMGMTDEYKAKIEEKIRIEENKEEEEKKDCQKGQHVASDEGDVCKNCLMPKEEWGKEQGEENVTGQEETKEE